MIALPGSAVASSAVPGVQSASTPVTTAATAPVLPAARAEAFVLPAAVLTAASAAEPAQTTAGGKAGPAATPSVPPAGMPGTFNMAGTATGTPTGATAASTPTARPTGVMPAAVVVGAGNVPGTTAPDATDWMTAAAAPTDNLAAAGAASAAAVAPPAPGPAAGTGAPAAAAPLPTPAQQPALQPQLARPLFTLAGAPHGQHIMTLKVSPEDLGPLTVRAHIDGAGVRIELFAPGDTGREALRGILPELRKELADAGFGASLDVSDHSGPAGGGRDAGQAAGQGAGGREASHAGSGGSGAGGRNGPGEPRPGHRWDALADEASLRTARILNGPQTTLDILV
ncbi:flagellar hook-length control protein FliK [uncultured Arthrobacter sp.]|uniref:flagellar hook-length control protein FliK n=1 Tax=uncultured Arthrobacter sp. TaxID=114050 RepID=UPI0032178AAF